MAKRNKRLKSSIKSYKKEIEKHFEKLDNEINKKDEILARYYIKEIDKSLITALEHKIDLIGAGIKDLELIRKYKSRLKEYKKKVGIVE